MPFTLSGFCEYREEIRKSRFITFAAPISSPAEAQAFIEQHSDLNASHNCWAWKLGDQYRSTDDGEPGGTAGRPMLEVLRHQQVEGALATVVRYFGGVKLGAGGLVRAYTDTVAQALLGATLVPLLRQRSLRCSVPYALEGLVRRELAAAGAVLEGVQHGDDVAFAFSLPEPEADAFIVRLGDAAQGRVVWQRE